MENENKTVIIDDIDVKRRIAEEVAKQQSYLIGHFTKTSVPDLVVTQWAAISFSNPTFLEYIAEEYAKIMKRLDPCDLICGIETAGIGLAAATAMKTNTPWIYSRKERKRLEERKRLKVHTTEVTTSYSLIISVQQAKGC